MSTQPYIEFPYRPIDTDAIEETHLVEAAKRGDEDAFARLFRRYSPKVYRSLVRILKDGKDAEDAVQETFLKAFLHLNTFEGKSRFSTWLLRIGINSALMELRKRQARRLIPLEGGDDENPLRQMDIADSRVDIHGACEVLELETNLKKALRRLKPAMRETFEIYQRLNCSHEDLAAMTHTSVATVKSRIFRARRALRVSLGLEHQRIA